MDSLLRRPLRDHPHITAVGTSGILSIFSLAPTPGMISIILTLSILLIYSRKIFPTWAHNRGQHATALWAALTIGGSISRLAASIHALSQPILSILILFILSGITSALSIGILFIETRGSSHYSSDYDSVRLLLFPTLWATFGITIGYLSPLGMLSAWSPLEGTGAYDWMLPIFGPESLNWVVAAWAVVVSETLMLLYMESGSRDEEVFPSLPGSLIPTGNESDGSYPQHMTVVASGDHDSVLGRVIKDKTVLLAAVLVLLTLPSYFTSSLPIPLGDVSGATPLVVGCALPTAEEYKVPEFGFEHYLTESKKLDGLANFILWPEGAVHFKSEAHKNETLDLVRHNLLHSFVGVSFEETLVDAGNAQNRHGIKRTGVAVVSNKSATPHLVYYKRHLVPIAESFSFTHSLEPPTTFTAEMRYKKNHPVHGHVRSVSVTASICLDYSDPSLFEALEVRPGLILAPARTWDVTVGYTMWKQASQRAHEIGSTLLWCDGGEGAVSGVAAQGINEVFQVGSGSWVRTIAIEHPFDERGRTLYAQYSDSALVLFWALLIGAPVRQRGGWFVQTLVDKIKRCSEFTSSPRDIPVGNLIDSDD